MSLAHQTHTIPLPSSHIDIISDRTFQSVQVGISSGILEMDGKNVIKLKEKKNIFKIYFTPRCVWLLEKHIFKPILTC